MNEAKVAAFLPTAHLYINRSDVFQDDKKKKKNLAKALAVIITTGRQCGRVRKGTGREGKDLFCMRNFRMTFYGEPEDLCVTLQGADPC